MEELLGHKTIYVAEGRQEGPRQEAQAVATGAGSAGLVPSAPHARAPHATRQP